MIGTCVACGCQIHQEKGFWVDNSGGDVCGVNGDNAPHYDLLETIEIVQCGSCDSYHRHEFHGDCRQDDERFASLGDAATRLGKPVNEVWEDEDGKIETSSPDFVFPGDLDN